MLFKLYRRQLIVETMPSLWAVEHLDVIEHITAGILPDAVDLPLDSLPFLQLEEAFRHRIVMTVTSAAHAVKQVVGFQKTLSIGAAELATLIRMNHHFLLWCVFRSS